MGPLSIEQVLAEEAAAIHDLTNPATRSIVERLRALAAGQARAEKRADKDADTRSGKDEEPQWVRDRKAFYCELGKLKSAALCLSGGGIRSATFGLGIIQALAQYSLAGNPAADGKVAPDTAEVEAKANESLLSRFHYLSTVSGGGYIGSWLSAWRHRNDFPTVWRNLSSRPDGPDVEPPEISWLRSYSNYLTPKVGIFSADTWTGIAIYVRNLLLNWLVIIPAVAAALLVLKIIVTVSVGVPRYDAAWWPHLVTLLAGIACLIVAQAYTTSHRPTRRLPPGADPGNDPKNLDQWSYLRGDLAWSLLSALLVTSTLTSAVGVALAGAVAVYWDIGVGAVLGVAIFAAGWIAGHPNHGSGKDLLRWSASGLIYGGFVGLGAYLFAQLMPYADRCPPSIWHLLLPVIFGVPWVLLAQLLADMVFVGLVSYEKNSDADREWLGRAAGWVAASAIIWIATTFISFAGGYFLIDYVWGQVLSPYIAGAGGLAGVVTAWLGKTGSGDAKPKQDQGGAKTVAKKIGMAIAGPLFAVLLVVGISVVLDLLLLGQSLVRGLIDRIWTAPYIFGWLTVGLLAALLVAWIASKNVNINRFSIHALYRNRLVRAYLGASRQRRCPDQFTGFDDADNMKAHELWPPRPSGTGRNTYCLFHVVNITLNVVKATRLAWQQRKAEPFTVSPLHSGAAYKGYRLSTEYGGRRRPRGISLGTAMAISGAAASPNMGYNSSTSITLLLALFNVRLGWWLGNPGKEGDGTYQEEGPRTAIRPLFDETFGLTTDSNPWVYLSDGGHFENLGIYEMVRRRNRVILAIDAGCDPDFKFEDLGNAVRKIYIDLGIRIFIDELDRLRNRPAQPDAATPYVAIGTIGYSEADGGGCEDGVLIYVKPAYHGVSLIEGSGVRSYAMQSEDFPHEPTADQWFTESQFESYRSLAFDIARTFMKGQKIIQPDKDTPAITLGEMLASLSPTARTNNQIDGGLR